MSAEGLIVGGHPQPPGEVAKKRLHQQLDHTYGSTSASVGSTDVHVLTYNGSATNSAAASR